MFATKNGFEISKDDGSYMYGATFFVDHGDRWGTIVGVLSEINSAAERSNLTDHLHVGYGPGLLSITFHSDEEISDEHLRLGSEIESILSPLDGAKRSTGV